ncbi:hypothetical protein P8452_04355 [Trifolium repens]|nr:hypothetical protein P8452_04355 [Trifolium repens]
MPATFNIFSFVSINEEDELLLHVLRYFLVLERSTVKFKSPNLASSNSQFNHTNWILDGGSLDYCFITQQVNLSHSRKCLLATAGTLIAPRFFRRVPAPWRSLPVELVLDILARRRKLTVDEESTKLGKLKDETQENIDRLKKKEAKIAELKYKNDKIEKKNAELIEKQRIVRNMKAAVVRRQKALDFQELKADVRKFKVAEIRTMKPKIRKHESELRKLRVELRKLQAQVPKLQAQVPKLHVEVERLMDVIQYLEDKVQQQADVLRDYEREFDGYKITFEERFKEFEDQKRKEAESSNAAAGEKVLEA